MPRITISNEPDGALVEVDAIDHALHTIGAIHANIHLGRFFTISTYDAAIADNDTLEVTLEVTSVVHITATASVQGDFLAQFFAGTTLNATPGGTVKTIFNRNGLSANTSDAVCRDNPTIDADGTEVLVRIVPGGSKAHASGGSGSIEERILGPGTYLLRLTNISGSAEGASLEVDFYHPA